MNRTLSKRWLTAYMWLAGMSDTCTGLLLVFAPAWTFSLMQIKQAPPPVFGGYIGVFVLGVGLSYFYAVRKPLTRESAATWETVWIFTALSRSLVAGFLGWKIFAGHLEPAWLTVAFTDMVLAAIQWTGLAKGWLRVHA